MERTLAIIKPDVVRARNSGKVIDMIEANGFTIERMQKMHLTPAQAEGFYAVHSARSFFGELTSFMSSGPVIVMVLSKENAIADWRKLMGETNPANAAAGTVRKLFGTNIGDNAVHGSDSPETAKFEVGFFFHDLK